MPNARTQLPAEVKELKAMIGRHAGSEPLLNALVALMKQAPDQSLVDAAFADIEPDGYSAAIRSEVARLLEPSRHRDLRRIWQGDGDPAPPCLAGNVVAFARPTADGGRPPEQAAVGFSDIGGLEEVKAQMRRKIIKPFLNQGLFQQFRRKSGGGILMYGPPGCGKTLLARALANECGAHFVNVAATDVLSPYIGVGEKRIVELFVEARASRPVVLFFDEIEALAQKRQFDSRAAVNTVVSSLLTEMDGFATDNEGVLLLGATNVPWSLDGAFRRPGRFDRALFVPPPDKVARRFILGRLLADRPTAPDLDLTGVVGRTSGYSGADLASVVETAVDFAIEDTEDGGTLCPVAARHLEEALREVRATTGEWLAQASSFGEYANRDGLYDDLKAFLKAHGR